MIPTLYNFYKIKDKGRHCYLFHEAIITLDTKDKDMMSIKLQPNILCEYRCKYFNRIFSRINTE